MASLVRQASDFGAPGLEDWACRQPNGRGIWAQWGGDCDTAVPAVGGDNDESRSGESESASLSRKRHFNALLKLGGESSLFFFCASWGVLREGSGFT